MAMLGANPATEQNPEMMMGQQGGGGGNHLRYFLSQLFPHMFGGGAQYDVGNFGPGSLGAGGPGRMGGAGLGAGPPQAGGFGGDIGSIFQGIFGNSGKPYDKESEAYDRYNQQGINYLNPYNQAGQRGMGSYEEMLAKMKDPQAFVNNILKGYTQSPWAATQNKYGQEAIQNAASASGLIGSSPLVKAGADYANELTSKDMQQYLSNVLGVNTSALSGYSDLSHIGLGAASQMAQMMQQAAEAQAQNAYGSQAGRNYDRNSMWGGIGDIISRFI
jgi:hypothetical protein